MALANDMTLLLNKITNRLGLHSLLPYLPDFCAKDKWSDIIKEDTIVTFSRYYPNKLPMIIDDNTCDKKDEDGVTWYYIKDEVLNGVRLLGIMDIDWQDTTSANSSITSLGGGQYYPNIGCFESTLSSIIGLQMNADMNSLYNNGIIIDHEYPGRFSLKGINNSNYNLARFKVILLVEHTNLSTISPTKMETFEQLAQCDIARFLFQNLKYYDGLETVYVNLDLKLSELENEASKRDNVIEKLENSYVSPSNDNIPYLWTV